MTWRFEDPQEGVELDFDTEQEALICLDQAIEEYADQARNDGEWPDGVDHLKVWKLAHIVKMRGEPDYSCWFEKAPFEPAASPTASTEQKG